MQGILPYADEDFTDGGRAFPTRLGWVHDPKYCTCLYLFV